MIKVQFSDYYVFKKNCVQLAKKKISIKYIMIVFENHKFDLTLIQFIPRIRLQD